MAYMSQEKKAKIAPVVKAICKRYGVKASLGVNHHSTLILNVKSGGIDFIKNAQETALASHNVPQIESAADIGKGGYMNVNPYHYDSHFSNIGESSALAFLTEIFDAMNVGNHDNSDIQSDYFDVGWYVAVNIGRWNKPYILNK